MRCLITRWGLAFGVLTFAGAAVGQAYPARPIRLVVPFPAGGVADLFGRMVGAKLGERLGQQVVIDNRGGASGIMGHDIVAKARPDGYTLLIASSPLAKNSMLYRKVPHDAIRDFTPVAPLATTPLIVVVHPTVPAQSVAELVIYAKANPGKLAFGASAPATAQHLAGASAR